MKITNVDRLDRRIVNVENMVRRILNNFTINNVTDIEIGSYDSEPIVNIYDY